MIISSQHIIVEEIVESYIERIQNGEIFQAAIASLRSDEFSEFGITAMLVDGHHRLEAYERLGLQIEFVEQEYNNYQAELDHLGMDGFLASYWMDGDWYDVETDQSVF